MEYTTRKCKRIGHACMGYALDSWSHDKPFLCACDCHTGTLEERQNEQELNNGDIANVQ